MPPLPRVAFRVADESPTGTLEYPRRYASIAVYHLEQAHLAREALATIGHLVPSSQFLPASDIDFASFRHDPFEEGPKRRVNDLSLESTAGG